MKATTMLKIAGGIAGGVLLVSLAAFVYRQVQQQEVLATRIDDYMRGFLPTLAPMSGRGEDVPLGKNAVWWIGDGVEYAGGGPAKSTGTMRSFWGGDALGAITPRFEELDAIVIVKGTLAEEKRYYAVPKGMAPLGLNPFGGPPISFIDKEGRAHKPEEFEKRLRTYALKVWVVDPKSNRIAAYREFPAEHLQEEYDLDHPANVDVVHLNALVDWIESLEKLGKKPALAQKPMIGPHESQKIALGAFTIMIPSQWTAFLAPEQEALARSVQIQSKEIYERYGGASDRSSTLNFVAFHTQDGGTFVATIYRVPPQADLMAELIKEAPQKAKWGMEKGFIKSASPVTPVARDGFDGFYLETESSSGSHDFVGGLVNTRRKTDVIQITFSDVKRENALAIFQNVLAGVNLVADTKTN